MSTTSAVWRKSSYSGNSHYSDCVEVASLARATVGVRDSTDLTRGHLSVHPRAWTAMTETVKH